METKHIEEKEIKEIKKLLECNDICRSIKYYNEVPNSLYDLGMIQIALQNNTHLMSEDDMKKALNHIKSKISSHKDYKLNKRTMEDAIKYMTGTKTIMKEYIKHRILDFYNKVQSPANKKLVLQHAYALNVSMLGWENREPLLKDLERLGGSCEHLIFVNNVKNREKVKSELTPCQTYKIYINMKDKVSKDLNIFNITMMKLSLPSFLSKTETQKATKLFENELNNNADNIKTSKDLLKSLESEIFLTQDQYDLLHPYYKNENIHEQYKKFLHDLLQIKVADSRTHGVLDQFYHIDPDQYSEDQYQKGGAVKTKDKRVVSDYNRFIGNQLKRGKSMADANKLWKTKSR